MTLLDPDLIAEVWPTDVTPEEVAVVLSMLTPDELRELDDLLTAVVIHGAVTLEAHQRPPAGLWRMWLLMAGRGAGKTQACATYMDDHAMGPACSEHVRGGHRMAIIAPTLGDALDACVEGPSGLRALNPGIVVRGGVQGKMLHWPNGAVARLFGVHTPNDVERLRAGGNRCLVWMEELAAWPHLSEGLAHMRFGLRVGPRPHAIGSTTPKNRPEIKALLAEANDPDAGVVVTTATTYDNPHLAQSFKDDLEKRYGGTRLGEQELMGKVLSDLGDVFKTSWFGTVVNDSPCPDVLAGTGWKRVRFWDMAATEAPETVDPRERMRLREENNDPDWTAGARVAWHAESRILVIEDMVRVRRSPAGVQAVILQTAAADSRGVPVRMEQEPGSSGKTVIANYRTLLSGYSFDGIRPSGDKVTRNEVWAGLAEQGRVVLVAGPWNAPFLDEAEEFTRTDTHDHDDQLDAVSGAVAFLLGTQPRRGGLRA
jgi:predicted phage terminase large subunit-like protein